uniref:Uncharacterized protein n=1 Tax=Anguilla anguilla TaxID=7936 RepID=A0A0E9X1L5_ANGAN
MNTRLLQFLFFFFFTKLLQIMHWDLLTDSNNSRSVFYSNKSRHGFSLPKPLVSTPEFKMLAIVQNFFSS